jgi:hypothetical protein
MFNLDNFKDADALKQHVAWVTALADRAREELASYEAELKATTEKLKTFSDEAVEAVQEKVEEVVDTVKEEVKKAAPKKAASKKAAAKQDEAEETLAEEPETDK